MKKYLIAASAAALTLGAGAALAADHGGPHRGPGMRLERLFQADANNDGAVSRAEFDAQRTAHFTELDSNNDGALTREEMREGWRRHAPEGGPGGGPVGGPVGGDGRERHGGHGWGNADANSDGNVTREEFLAGPAAHFDRLDANDDGVLSADERPQRRERPEGERRAHRIDPDANNDGQISRTEFAAGGDAMFARLDADANGSITRAEAEAAGPHHRRHEQN